MAKNLINNGECRLISLAPLYRVFQKGWNHVSTNKQASLDKNQTLTRPHLHTGKKPLSIRSQVPSRLAIPAIISTFQSFDTLQTASNCPLLTRSRYR